MGFSGYSFLCLDGCFSMIVWTPTVLSVLYACVLYFCMCTCSAQLSMFHMERRSLLLLYNDDDYNEEEEAEEEEKEKEKKKKKKMMMMMMMMMMMVIK